MPPVFTAPAKLGAIAAALARAFEPIPEVAVYEHEPVGTEMDLPAITIGTVALQRTEIDEPERQLASDDWRQSWSVTLLVAMHDPEVASARTRRIIGEMVEAIDLDHTLGGEAVEARLTAATQGYGPEDHDPRLIVVECDVQVLALMPRL